MLDGSTICAISTPSGPGAIAVVRLSGKDAVSICNKFFFSKGKTLIKQKPNTLHFGTIRDGDKIIDEVVVGIFKAPHSYTGEDVIEVSCHGATIVQQQLLQLFINNGAQLAKPGEFTMRAFLNGKMDLSQAEAVADLIASTSRAAHKVAINQMRGGFSDEIKKLREKLLNFTSLIELELDFTEEDIEFADRKELKDLVLKINTLIGQLINSFSLGNVIKNGVPVAIVGKPNVGKSTLLNSLVKDEKAIVSEIPGTTRDAIEDTIYIEGLTFRFIDTAGLRETSDFIENLGIRKTYQKIKQASIVLLLVDATDDISIIQRSVNEILKQTSSDDKHLILVINKTDKVSKSDLDKKFTRKELDSLREQDKFILISALDSQDVHNLAQELVKTINFKPLEENDIIITNTRHYEALIHSSEAVKRVLKGLEQEISGDFLAQDIREVLHYLGEITGEITTDEILGNIFSKFCIGK
jgi:tRNA modification GTPase